MTETSYKPLYSRFLKGHEGRLHFAAHSHHFWPDVSREGHMQYWDDCALKSDEKWSRIFGEIIPEAQKTIASMLNLKSPQQIVFAPNTHELLYRILSLFIGQEEISVVTTSSEFHSWRRQLMRLEEEGVKVEIVSTDQLFSDKNSFMLDLKDKLLSEPDVFFISQVFFDSGLALTNEDLLELYEAKSENTLMVVDGYHAFAALPVDLSKLEGKIFYLAGGYKYAQAGEGVGFMLVPKGDWRPVNTGWFAEMGSLSMPAGKQVGYAPDASAFLGATQDYSGVYRFNFVWNLFRSRNLDVISIHERIQGLQTKFIEGLPASFISKHNLRPIYRTELSWHGHFLTYQAPDAESALKLQEKLLKANIIVDCRGPRVRFGFGMYHDLIDVIELCRRLEE